MKLFPHNQEAYDSAVRMFKKEKRVCIIHPTGTGKSVIIAEFVNRNPSKRHLLLAPGTHIFSEIQKHLGKVGISCSTYIGLKRNESFFGKNTFDYIYLDEFHRLGADVWGGAVERLLKLNPRAKVLGTSATPVRYLDDQRNMATEIFKDRIASQMSLISAISDKVLPAPTYVSALYSVKDEYRLMKNKVLSSNLKNKETILRDLDSKMIDWEKSSGLDVIITKHLGNERRRVIVFCKDWEHLQYAQKLLDPIFRKIFFHVRSLSLYSKKKLRQNEISLRNFRSENGSAIVLYAIDKVSEGLHSKACNTVILFRDTISPNVFYQQIGRAFSIGATNRPLILDLVNNFRNIKLDPFTSNSEQGLNLLTKGGQSDNDEKSKEKVTLIDYTEDIKQVFSSFENMVDSWKRMYVKAKAYFSEHGHLYVSSSDTELYKWVRHQISAYRNGDIGKERAHLLRTIGVNFDIPACWSAMLFDLQEWVREKGRLPTFEEGSRLYNWMVRQRQAFRAGTLIQEQIIILQKLFFLEDKRTEERVERLVKHFERGNWHSADETIKHDLVRIRDAYRKNQLSETTLNDLRKANVHIDKSVNDLVWLSKVKDVLAFFKEKRKLPGPEDKRLYEFCIRERASLNKRHPYAKLIGCNSEVKILFERFQRVIKASVKPDWDNRYSELKRMAELHGRISKLKCDKNLIAWMTRQKQALKNGRLTAEQMSKLLEIKEVNWNGKFAQEISG